METGHSQVSSDSESGWCTVGSVAVYFTRTESGKVRGVGGTRPGRGRDKVTDNSGSAAHNISDGLSLTAKDRNGHSAEPKGAAESQMTEPWTIHSSSTSSRPSVKLWTMPVAGKSRG